MVRSYAWDKPRLFETNERADKVYLLSIWGCPASPATMFIALVTQIKALFFIGQGFLFFEWMWLLS
jgi:hypothetical protein